MKIKHFAAREIQFFELRIFFFNSYVCYLTLGFIASFRVFILVTRAFNLPTRAFSLLTRGSGLATRGFELVTRSSKLLFYFSTYVLCIYFVFTKKSHDLISLFKPIYTLKETRNSYFCVTPKNIG